MAVWQTRRAESHSSASGIQIQGKQFFSRETPQLSRRPCKKHLILLKKGEGSVV
jgi:hypothetical protein